MVSKKLWVAVLVFVLASPIFLDLQVHAQSQQPTLAQTIEAVLQNVNLTGVSPQWGSIYSQIFGLSNASIFDVLISEAVNASDWNDAVWVARLAELNGYSSQIISSGLVTALENMSMCGNLPISCANANQETSSYPADAFCVYDRYLLNAYRYAQQYDVSGWNATGALMDLANAVLTAPKNYVYTGSKQGELLWVNPSVNFAASYSSRFYDEYAETLGAFLELAENGADSNITCNGLSLNATSFMDYMWSSIQSLWAGNSTYGYYSYNNGYNKGVNLTVEMGNIECESGAFTELISEYQNYRGELPYFNRVIENLEYTLLAEGWNSPMWATTDVVKHATSTPFQEERLAESLGEVTALQELYLQFSPDMQQSFQSMLTSGWQGLINSDLYVNGTFSFFADFNDSDATFDTGTPSADASLVGTMLLFLDGIIPQSGSLAINASNERYQDYQTCFPVNQWQFNYADQTITIPVFAGTLGFIFGSQEVTQNFPSNGVYQIQFSTDWNSITSATKIAEITIPSLAPAVLQTQIKPSQSASPTPTPVVIWTRRRPRWIQQLRRRSHPPKTPTLPSP